MVPVIRHLSLLWTNSHAGSERTCHLVARSSNCRSISSADSPSRARPDTPSAGEASASALPPEHTNQQTRSGTCPRLAKPRQPHTLKVDSSGLDSRPGPAARPGPPGRSGVRWSGRTACGRAGRSACMPICTSTAGCAPSDKVRLVGVLDPLVPGHQPARPGLRALGEPLHGPGWQALGLARCDRRCFSSLESGGKQVAGRQAAVGPPFLGDGEDLLWAGEVIPLIGGLNGLTERKVARQDDVFSLEREDEGALRSPGTYPRNRGELRQELVVNLPRLVLPAGLDIQVRPG
jgi:hypothetical protein